VAAHVPRMADTAGSVWTLPPVVFDRLGAGRSGSDGTKASELSSKAVPSSPREMKPITDPRDTRATDTIVPVTTMQPFESLPGSAAQIDTTSTGLGSGSGPGVGRGPGSGLRDGPGLGNDGAIGPGGDVLSTGNGVTSPQLIKEVKPNYTGDAMRAKLQGVVEMEAVVLPDGTVDPARIRVTRSLDSVLGLDQQAIAAVKQWRFRPGTFKGQAVAVRVNVELTFTLR